MPKMKTVSGAKKRFKLSANGKVRGRRAKTSHNFSAEAPKLKRQRRQKAILCPADAKSIRRQLRVE